MGDPIISLFVFDVNTLLAPEMASGLNFMPRAMADPWFLSPDVRMYWKELGTLEFTKTCIQVKTNECVSVF